MLSLNTEHIRCVLFVCDADIDIGHQLAHDLTGLLACPELLAVIEVAADGYAVRLCGLAGFHAGLDHVLTQCRSDAGEVEPLCAAEDGIPVDLYKLLIESIRFRSSSKRNFFAKGY